MTITEVIAASGKSKRWISERFGIPYRTLLHWTTDGPEHRDPPAYVVQMLQELLKKERA